MLGKIKTSRTLNVCSVSMETSWYAFTHPNSTTLYLLFTSLCTGELNAIRKQKILICCPFHGRACRRAMVGAFKT
jgi:hypothetical protein